MDSLLQGRHFQPCCMLYLICCTQNLLSFIFILCDWKQAHYLDWKASLIPNFEMKTNKTVDYIKPGWFTLNYTGLELGIKQW